MHDRQVKDRQFGGQTGEGKTAGGQTVVSADGWRTDSFNLRRVEEDTNVDREAERRCCRRLQREKEKTG